MPYDTEPRVGQPEVADRGYSDQGCAPLRRLGPGAALAASGHGILALQRSAGNAAVIHALSNRVVQRQAHSVPVGPVLLNNARISVPIPSGTSLSAAVPAGQSVTWSLLPGTAAVDSGSSISSTGVITLGASQAGGRIEVQATDAGGSGATASLEAILVKPPGSITSTAETTGASTADYGAGFRHTFAASGGGAATEMEGGRVNEIFPGVPSPNGTSHRMPTPFGPFTLTTTNPASTTAGWGIDSGGQMTGDDNVTHERAGVDIRRFVTNTSNPAPAQTLPVSFTITQNLRSLEVPTNNWRIAFASPPHIRGLREGGSHGAEFFISANGAEHTDDYTGRPAVRTAQADQPTVAASAPRPSAPRGRPRPPAPTPNTVQISGDPLPDGARLTFSIQGPALGCSINARTGVLTIGLTDGTVRVRVAEPGGVSFDEVTVTITPRPAPTPGGTP